MKITHAIRFAKNALIQAQTINSSREYACAEARRIYKHRCQGMYKQLEAEAKRSIKIAKEHGLTEAKPYVLRTDKASGKTRICGIHRGHLVAIR